MSDSTHRYGWIPDLPDHRDVLFTSPVAATKLPPKADLRAGCPPVYDQGQLGDCTANAIAAAIDFERHRQKEEFITPSRLFIYYNERAAEHTVNSDAGARIRDGIKSVNTQGAPAEKLWPYEITKFEQRPPDTVYTSAKLDRAVSYARVARTLNQLKGCLAAGFPFVLGISVYDSFESEEVARTGHVPLPKPSESLLGGHAVMAVGYSDHEERFLVRNSWGEKWGQEGYFTLPYAYLTDTGLASDFWTIRMVGA